jgi:ankyrin repeat protein
VLPENKIHHSIFHSVRGWRTFGRSSKKLIGKLMTKRTIYWIIIVGAFIVSGYANADSNNLFDVAYSGDIVTVEKLIDSGADINAEDNRTHMTALMGASSEGHMDIAELLINKGADVNAKATALGRTALIWASEFGHKDVAELLISKGADVNAKDKKGETALSLASKFGHKDVAELLIDKGANVNTKRKDGGTALMSASALGHKDVAELLIAKEADVNAKDENGETALTMAIIICSKASENRHKDVVELLIAKGADINAKSNGGSTALIDASAAGHMNIVKLLIAKGADVNARTNGGDTALMDASANGYKDITELLISKGADINVKNKKGETALFLTSSQNLRTLDYLLKQQIETWSLKNVTDRLEKLKSEQSQWEKDVLGSCRTPECVEYAYISRILSFALQKTIIVSKLDPDQSNKISQTLTQRLSKTAKLDIESCESALEVRQRASDWDLLSSYGVSCNLKNSYMKLFMCDDLMVGKFTAMLSGNNRLIDLPKFIATSCPPGG